VIKQVMHRKQLSKTVTPVVSHVLQRAAISQTPVHEVPPVVHEVLRSPGQPLDAETRAYMEPRFGFDFSGVRTHRNERLPVPMRLTIAATDNGYEQSAEMTARRVTSQTPTAFTKRHDFSGVQIHTDSKAHQHRLWVHWRYTVGNISCLILAGSHQKPLDWAIPACP